jgi:dipeptidyl aminopeptidase/acylaminoacyl peptidase
MLAAVSAIAAPRGFTPHDLVGMDRITSADVSPDGSHVVYTQRSTDIDKNRSRTQVWLLDLRDKNAKPKQLTNENASSTDPVWSPKGDAIYFLSSRSKGSQVWRVPAQGGEAVMVTDLPVGVDTFKLSPQGDRLAFTAETYRDCPDLACSAKRKEEADKSKAKARIYDRLFIRHWDTFGDGRQNGLFSIALGADGKATGAPVSLSGKIDGDVVSKPSGDNSEYSFSPDGGTVIFSAREAGKTESWSTNFDLFAVPSAGGTPSNLTAANKAWDTEPVFSPDGKLLAYRAMSRPTYEADRFQIMLMDNQGKTRKLAEKWDRSARGMKWSADGKSLYVLAQDVGQVRLFKIDVATGRVDPLTGPGTIVSYSMGGDKVVALRGDLMAPPQLNVLPAAGGDMHQLTTANAQLLSEVQMGAAEQFSFAGANSDKVYGYVVKPANYEKGKKYPVAFIVHGGPQSSMSNSWSYRWNPQVFAGAGYAVVFIDFHGSTGYGQKFTDAINKDWGGKPLEDLKKGLAAAAGKYDFVDTSKACALGASYGGFMMNWIAGQWNTGFKCLVNHAGIFDQRSFYYSTEELWFPEYDQGGPYFDNPKFYERSNPVNYVKNWKTPTLVIHGELDYRVPLEQGLGTFTALQRRGIESKLVLFPGENHHILGPNNSLLWHKEVLGWLEKHLK